MKPARLILLVFLVACASAPTPSNAAIAEQSQDAPSPPEVSSQVDLRDVVTLLDESDAARKASDYATARATTQEAVAALLARSESEPDAQWLQLSYRALNSAWDAQDARTAQRVCARMLDVRARTLPDDHPALQAARHSYAGTLFALGDLAHARALQEKVLDVYSRTLPDDHPNLQRARGNLAATMKAQGDFAGARAIEESLLATCARALPPDDPVLQAARGNLAITLFTLGNRAKARELLTGNPD